MTKCRAHRFVESVLTHQGTIVLFCEKCGTVKTIGTKALSRAPHRQRHQSPNNAPEEAIDRMMIASIGVGANC